MSAPEAFHGDRALLYPGDCLATLNQLDEHSVDSCVTDPPYHLHSIVRRFGSETAAPAKAGTTGAYARASKGFMSKTWDGGDIAFRPETWAKVFRVLKPGAYVVAFSSSRTFARMAVAIEDAGFVTHPMIAWLYGQGFPKATRVNAPGFDGQRYGAQALKPSLEPIYVGQKPFSEANGTANILRWGTGAVRIDDCRVEGSKNVPASPCRRDSAIYGNGSSVTTGNTSGFDPNLGRWPPNLVHDGSPEVLALFPESGGQQRAVGPEHGAKSSVNVFGNYGARHAFEPRGNSGSTARFFPSFPPTEADCAFYRAKSGTDDRLGSRHPTIKPLDLMRWLVRLHTPKGGLVVDPFAGTGTTGHAALIEGCRALLCEADSEHCDDIRRRMSLVYAGADERAHRLATVAKNHGPLFAEAAE